MWIVVLLDASRCAKTDQDNTNQTACRSSLDGLGTFENRVTSSTSDPEHIGASLSIHDKYKNILSATDD
eukprot:4594502-Pleurochrysis_carterae.AAC.2